MDKFVTRTPSWKTMHFAPPQNSLEQPRRVDLNKTKTKLLETALQRKQPLKEKHRQMKNIVRSDTFGCRLSIRDEKLLKIFCSQPDQPLMENVTTANDEDSGLSSSSSTTERFPLGGFENKLPTTITFAAGDSASCVGDENKPFPASISTNMNKHLGELSDYVNCANTRSQLLVSQASSATIDDAFYGEVQNRSQSPKTQIQSPYTNTPKANPQMARLQRDLQSPSAALRIRALKALQSPQQSPYTHFDVPHDEQSIITAEERCTPASAPTIQELMENIVVYVEVRTGEDNRSAGVKNVISMLGARVNNKLLRDTTHVIFKDGLLSTYKKAKNWNIPVVSILWIEACKNKRMICDPKDFPISNIDRYENPELYDKMKRQKSMQPDSESNKRIRAKRVGLSKDSNGNTVTETLKKASTLIGDTLKLSSNKKTDIGQYFKQLGSIKKPQQKINAEVTGTPKTPANYDMVTESPATQLLNRMNSNCYTPIADYTKNRKSTNKKASKDVEKVVSNDADVIVIAYDAKRKLNYWSKDQDKTPKEIVTRGRSMQCRTNIENETICTEDIPQEKEEETPKITRRRSMQRTIIDKAINSKQVIPQDKEDTPKGIVTRRRSMQLSTNTENETVCNQYPLEKEEETPKITRRRSMQRTIFEKGTISKQVILQEEEEDTPKGIVTRRRSMQLSTNIEKTKHSQKENDESGDNVTVQKSTDTPIIENKRRRSSIHVVTNMCVDASEIELQSKLCTQFDAIAEEDTSNNTNEIDTTDSITQNYTPKNRIIKRRSTYTNKSINVSEIDTTKTASNELPVAATPNKRRRTLYTPQKMEETKIIELNENIKDSPTEPMPATETSVSEIASAISITATVASNNFSTSFLTTTTGNSNISLTSFPTTVASSTLLPMECTPKSTGVAASLLDEQARTTVFNSAHQPGRRRTLFDVSMDIITQRLQNINNSARRSVVPERPATNDVAEPEVILNKPRTMSDLKLNDVSQTGPTKGSETTFQINKDTVSTNNETEEAATPNIKKKRKLFVPNDNQWTPPVQNPLLTSTAKRRRTMMPLSTPSSSPVIKSVAKKMKWNMLQHCSSLAESASSVNDQQIFTEENKKLDEKRVELPIEEKKTDQNEKNERNGKEKEPNKKESQGNKDVSENEKMATLPPFDANIAESQIASCENVVFGHQPITEALRNHLPPVASISLNKLQGKVTEAKEINNAPTLNEKKKLPFLVCTNMHKEQLQVIREAIDRIGGFHLAHFVTAETTHVVSYEPRRTLNLLRALVRGLWILDYSWIVESLRAGEWIGEEQFELKEFTRAVEICRAERQAFGNLYKCELFTDLGPFYVSSRCGPISKENLKELIELCGGKIVDQRRRAKYILGDAQKSLEDKVYITPFWILDSITQMQVLKFQKYTYPTDTQLRAQKLQQQHLGLPSLQTDGDNRHHQPLFPL